MPKETKQRIDSIHAAVRKAAEAGKQSITLHVCLPEDVWAAFIQDGYMLTPEVTSYEDASMKTTIAW